MKIDATTKRRTAQAIVYLMGVRRITQYDVADHAKCTTYAVHRVIYGDLHSERVTKALCELMGYANRDQLEIAACEALNKVQEAHPKRKVAHV